MSTTLGVARWSKRAARLLTVIVCVLAGVVSVRADIGAGPTTGPAFYFLSRIQMSASARAPP
jgi:hypothetical protein